MPLTVSVIIVSYNTCSALRRCLESLVSEDVVEVIVIDNASRDGSADMVEAEFPSVKLIRNSVNRGFGAANNQGLDLMTGAVALLLNSDIVVKPGAIRRLSELFRDTGVVAAGGKLLFPDGTLQQSACSPLTLAAVLTEQLGSDKISLSLGRPYWISKNIAAKGQPAPVAQVMGACLMMRPRARFDERFFLYCEDTDLCRRLSAHGKIIYHPGAEFIHELGASSAENRGWSVAMYNLGKELYFGIHHGKIARSTCFLIDRIGAFYRMMGYLLLARSARVKLWWQVFRTPWNGPSLPEDAQPSRPA